MESEGMLILLWLIVGAVAGWLATLVVGAGGYGLVGDIILGMVGAAVAGWLFPYLGWSLGGGMVGAILAAALGAILVLLVIRLIKRA